MVKQQRQLLQIEKNLPVGEDRIYTASDWESDAKIETDASESEDDLDDKTKRGLMKSATTLTGTSTNSSAAAMLEYLAWKTQQPWKEDQRPQLASEVKSEKQRREDRIQELHREAGESRRHTLEGAPTIGRLYNDDEGGVMEEAERDLEVLQSGPTDALEVLTELNKKKELKSIDHGKIEYIDVKKNLYIVPRSLASLTTDEIADRRAKLKVKIRGVGCPAPVSDFREFGFPERILAVLNKMKIHDPFPVQAQCLPIILAGRVSFLQSTKFCTVRLLCG